MFPLSEYIDHTLLKPTASHKDFEQLLDDAIKYKFASVCVSPHMAISIKAVLSKTSPDLRVCTVVGFPHGNQPVQLKYNAVEYFISREIDEVDFVINYGELINNNVDVVRAEINTVGVLCRRAGVVSKAIIETCYLTKKQKIKAFELVRDSFVDFIKTSTGYGPSGAQLQDVVLWDRLRAKNKGPLIKAAGGIKDYKTALRFIKAGANRLGMSASVSVMEDYYANITEGEEKT